VEVELAPGTSEWLRQDTRFWIVRPKLDATGITGLGTLLTGTYIGMDPGRGDTRETTFDALADPPVLLSSDEGTLYTLRAPTLGSLTIGSPLYFRQIRVGEVVQFHLAENHQYVEIEVFVRAPHDAYVHRSSRFWNASGVNLNLSTEGVEVDMESIAALLTGGIAFETPRLLASQGKAPQGHSFTLYENRKASIERPITLGIPYLLYFPETVRGLNIGAPVEFRGIRVGTVKDISIQGELNEATVQIPVLIEMEPDRVLMADAELPDDPQARKRKLEELSDVMIDNMLQQGLRARLIPANLLTGQLIVEFDLYPEDGPGEVRHEGPYVVLPTLPNPFSSITDSLTSILDRIDALPIDAIGANLLAASDGARELMSDEQLAGTAKELRSSIAELDRLLQTLNRETGPLLTSYRGLGDETLQLVKDMRSSVVQAEQTFAAVESIVGENSPVGSELKRALEEISAAARSIRIMADYLERHPEALLQGKGGR
jgi:paraquat-inducible protein B